MTPRSRRALCVAGLALVLAGCGAGAKDQGASAELDQACRSATAESDRIGPITRLRDVAPALRQAIAVDRAVLAALRRNAPDDEGLIERARTGTELARRALDAIERTDPLQSTMMSTIGSSVPAARRVKAEMRALVTGLCRRQAPVPQ